MSQLPLPIRLDAHARFTTFVAGENAAALGHLRRLGTGRPGEAIWLWGPASSGKSHLLQAACAETAEEGRRAIYLPMRSPRASQPGLLEGLEALDVVAVDDVGAALGESGWDRALFGLHNELVARGACLLMTADQPPTAMTFSFPDLASRAAGAVVYRLSPLSEKDTLLALQGHARYRGLDLPESAARYLLNHVERNMAALCGWLDTLDRASLVAQRRLTIPFIREVLDLPASS